MPLVIMAIMIHIELARKVFSKGIPSIFSFTNHCEKYERITNNPTTNIMSITIIIKFKLLSSSDHQIGPYDMLPVVTILKIILAILLEIPYKR